MRITETTTVPLALTGIAEHQLKFINNKVLKNKSEWINFLQVKEINPSLQSCLNQDSLD